MNSISLLAGPVGRPTVHTMGTISREMYDKNIRELVERSAELEPEFSWVLKDVGFSIRLIS